MKPRLLHAALVAVLACLLLAASPTRATADDQGGSDDPSTPVTTELPSDDDTTAPDERSDAVTVGLQPATEEGPDARATYAYEIEPSGVRQDYVAVFNYSDRPVRVGLLARDATTTPDSPFAVQENDEESTDVGTWVVLSEKRMKLAPRTTTLVPFQIGVPYNATPGDHVGAIVLTVLDRHTDSQVTVQNRVGLRLYLRVPGALAPELSIEDLRSSFDGTWTSFGMGRNTVDFTLRNTGNVRLSGETTVDLLRSFGLADVGMRAESFEELLPGGHLEVHQVSGRFFAVGDLTTRVVSTPHLDDDGTALPPVVAETTQRVLPWGLAATAVIVLAIASLLARLFRRWSRRRPPKVKNPSHRRHGPPPEREPVGVGASPSSSSSEPRSPS